MEHGAWGKGQGARGKGKRAEHAEWAERAEENEFHEFERPPAFGRELYKKANSMLSFFKIRKIWWPDVSIGFLFLQTHFSLFKTQTG